METGESIVRLLGGAAIGVIFAFILRIAPPPVARMMVTAAGVVIVALLLLGFLGLGRKAILLLAVIVGGLLLAGVVKPSVAQTLWIWLHVGGRPDRRGHGRRAGRDRRLRCCVTWGLVGALLNLLAGSFDLASLGRALGDDGGAGARRASRG